MSFNPNHSILMITRDNYEEYFLLYVDEELTPEQKKAVDDFVLLHSDLKDELDLLCSTRLPEDAISFQNKEELLADNMKVTTVDESLLLYIDDELPDREKETVEQQLMQDDVFALQHNLLLKTKSDRNEYIPYPNKKELYRSTEKRIVPYWLRVAVAAALIITTGTVVWMNMDTAKSSGPAIAVVKPDHAAQQTTPAAKQINTLPITKAPETIARTEKKAVVKKENALVASTSKTDKRPTEIKKQEPFSKTHITDDNIAQNNIHVDKKATADDVQTAVAATSQQVLNNLSVTSPKAAPYIPVIATDKNLVPENAVATTNEKGGGMKGFLRKATRFIERRTGIKTVNENDELLVGALALKL